MVRIRKMTAVIAIVLTSSLAGFSATAANAATAPTPNRQAALVKPSPTTIAQAQHVRKELLALGLKPNTPVKELSPELKAQVLKVIEPAVGLSYTFNKDATSLIYEAAQFGDFIAAVCSAYAPSWAAPICDVIDYVSDVIANLGAPGYHDCLQAYLILGWPPVGVQYVYC